MGNAAGRNFQGSHGNGLLSSASGFEGNATPSDWPGIDAVTSRVRTLSIVKKILAPAQRLDVEYVGT